MGRKHRWVLLKQFFSHLMLHQSFNTTQPRDNVWLKMIKSNQEVFLFFCRFLLVNQFDLMFHYSHHSLFLLNLLEIAIFQHFCFILKRVTFAIALGVIPRTEIWVSFALRAESPTRSRHCWRIVSNGSLQLLHSSSMGQLLPMMRRWSSSDRMKTECTFRSRSPGSAGALFAQKWYNKYMFFLCSFD
jgi:hypothetical protein